MKALLKAAVPLLALNFSAFAQAPQVATDLEGKLRWTVSESDGEYKLGLVETGEPEPNTYVGFLLRCRRTGLNTINTDLFDTRVVGTNIQKNEPLNVSLIFDGREKPMVEVSLAYNQHDNTWEFEVPWSESNDGLFKEFSDATQVAIRGDGINVLLPRSGMNSASTRFQQKCFEVWRQ